MPPEIRGIRREARPWAESHAARSPSSPGMLHRADSRARSLVGEICNTNDKVYAFCNMGETGLPCVLGGAFSVRGLANLCGRRTRERHRPDADVR